MTKSFKLPGTDIETSSLGFGCAGLMRCASSRTRQALLNEAYSLGIRHFDIARMYGLGKAEQQVGRFLPGRRDTVTLTTKFGIEVKPAVGLTAVVQSAGRIAIRLMPALRKAAQRQAGALYAPRDYSAVAARRSLEASLSALGTDYIDLFMLHEPTRDAVQYEDILEFLEQARDKGLIRAWGLAGYPHQIMPICETAPSLADVLQLPNDVLNRQVAAFRNCGHNKFITFSPYSGAIQRIGEHLAARPGLERSWSDALGMNVAQPETLARLVLGWCLDANPEGIVLFSSTRKEGVRSAADTWTNPVPPDITQRFAELITAENALRPRRDAMPGNEDRAL